MPIKESLPILSIMGDYVMYPLPHQTKLIEVLNQDTERQEFLRAIVESRSMDEEIKSFWLEDETEVPVKELIHA